MSVITVRVAPARLVRAPSGAAVPDVFRVEQNDPYWAKMLRQGDVVAADAKGSASVAPALAATKEPAK